MIPAVRFIGFAFAWIAGFIWTAWSFGALYFDFPIAALRLVAAVVLVAGVLAALVFVRGPARKLTAIFAACALVNLWWLTLKAPAQRDWQADVAETAWAEIDGDAVTIHNVRNCDYRTETDFDVQYLTRTVDLSKMEGVDIAITYWGSPLIAHPIVSFRFSDTPPLCFSIETRKAVGQNYSAVRGLYRQFTLIYIAAEERDPIRLRTNYRKGEDVYLYRTLLSPDQARSRFREYLTTLNTLHQKPRWYNAVTTNCTTTIRAQHPESQRIPWDWRILANGKGDELLYERKVIATDDLSFAELKQRSHINERARAADQDPDFSKRIRDGSPGFASR